MSCRHDDYKMELWRKILTSDLRSPQCHPHVWFIQIVADETVLDVQYGRYSEPTNEIKHVTFCETSAHIFCIQTVNIDGRLALLLHK